jgi:hypothetical protein
VSAVVATDALAFPACSSDPPSDRTAGPNRPGAADPPRRGRPADARADARFAAVVALEQAASPPADQVTIIDLQRGRVSARASVAGGPHDHHVAVAGRRVLVAVRDTARLRSASVGAIGP